MVAFVPAAPLAVSTFAPSSTTLMRAPTHLSETAAPRMSTSTYRYSPMVDQFFANDVRAQYVAKACPTGVPPMQCIEGTTASEPYAARTLKRQSALRYRQLPTAVKLHNMYETRRTALRGCHGCGHEEDRVLRNPMMASAMAIGQAEATRACSRYIPSSGPAEDAMVRAMDNVYSAASTPSGVFSTACTDGQAKYEAYLSAVRGGSVAFRATQYSAAAKASSAFAARKLAISTKPLCAYEVGLYSRFPRLAGSVRPAFGYYTPVVTLPSEYMYPAGVVAQPDAGRAAAVAVVGKMTWTSVRSLSVADAAVPQVV